MTTDGLPPGGSGGSGGFKPKFFTQATEEAPPKAGEDLLPYDDGYLTEDPEDRPDFFRVEEADLTSLEDFTYSAIKFRHKEVARRYALGHPRKQIAKALSYTPEAVTLILKRPEVKREVLRYRQILIDRNITDALKDLGPEALGNVEELLRDKGTKPKDRFEASKWVIEKLSGKPKQEVEVNDTSFTHVMDILTQLRESGESLPKYQDLLKGGDPAELIDVTPEPQDLEIKGERTENDSQLEPQPQADPLTLGKNLFD